MAGALKIKLMMEQNQESIFGFGIDSASRSHLSEAAKWAKFLAIIGFIMCGLIVVFSFFVGAIFTGMSGYNQYGDSQAFSSGLGTIMTVMYLGIGVLYFFPCLFLLRFANNLQTALNTNEQHTLNRSFQNLKIMFRYVGILTIIVISLYILAFLFGIASAALG
jgi:uncharacterized membrane protein YjgN (DUF898 family)